MLEKIKVPYLLAFFVLIGASVSFGIYSSFKELELEQQQQAMEADAKAQFLAIERGIIVNFEVLDSLKSFYDATHLVSRRQFTLFVSSLLKQYSNAQALEWIPFVPNSQRKDYEDRALKDGLENFSIKERQEGVMVRSPSRPSYFPVYYIEPLKGNEAALGFDLASNARRLEALNQSRDDGAKVATAPITLVQETKQQAGLLIFNPVYYGAVSYDTVKYRRKFLKGFVLMVLRIEDMLNQTLGENAARSHIWINDITQQNQPENIFVSFPNESVRENVRVYKRVLNVAGRQWEVAISPMVSSYQQYTTILPGVLLACGLIATGLFAFILQQMTRKRQWVEGLVEQRTTELQESDAFGELILSSIPDLIFVKDGQFRIVKANPAFLQLYPESQRDQVIGTTTIEDYDQQQADEFLKYDREAFAKGYSETYETIDFPNGKTHTLLTKKVRFENNQGEPFILGIAVDVTEREKLIQQLTQSNEELDEFAYIASHDLKEPLRGIHNHASMYLRTIDADDNDGVRRLGRIMELTQYMETLISDLLYFSRMGRTDIAMQKTDMHQLVQDIIGSMPTVDEPGIQVSIVDPLPSMICDRVRVGEVFRNLIDNALKYHDGERKNITIGLSTEKAKSNNTVFYIRDDGIGIDEKFHHEIFRIFKRLHKKTDYGGGTGSGLTFVKKIIERHGGRIWLESAKGVGTTFYFSLFNESLAPPNNDSGGSNE